jgi:hypothetical protein
MNVSRANWPRRSLEAIGPLWPRASGSSTDAGPGLRYALVLARYNLAIEAAQKPFRTGNYKLRRSASGSITVPASRVSCVHKPVSSNAEWKPIDSASSR